MLRPTGILALIQFFEGALPEAAFWGRLALGVGLLGFSYSLALVWVYRRDSESLKSGAENPDLYRAPKRGLLDSSLGDFFADPLASAPLSPDAASEYVTGRLDAERDATLSRVRFFAYAPLLIGLMGTITGLRSLLVGTGRTLQDIEPLLSGVFAGTLGGIAGSLMAAFGSLILDKVALDVSNQAQDFIHRYIIPSLPERRIAVRIEEAVLELVAERTQAVVAEFRNSMIPVAAELEEVAARCSKSAEAATGAFSEAHRALREAGNIGEAARSFKSGAHMIDSAAEQLVDATKQTAEVILRLGEVRGSMADLLEEIKTLADFTARTSLQVCSRVDEQIQQMERVYGGLEASTAGLTSSIDSLRSGLSQRAQAEADLFKVVSAQLKTVQDTLEKIAQLADNMGDSANRLTKSTESIAAALDASWKKNSDQFDSLIQRIIESTGKTPALAERPLTVDKELIEAVRQATVEMRQLSKAAEQLMETFKRNKEDRRGIRRFFPRWRSGRG